MSLFVFDGVLQIQHETKRYKGSFPSLQLPPSQHQLPDSTKTRSSAPNTTDYNTAHPDYNAPTLTPTSAFVQFLSISRNSIASNRSLIKLKMFRFVFLFAFLFASAVAYPAAKPAISDVQVPAVTKVTRSDIDTRMSQYLPTVSKPNELHACYCISQGKDCSSILAASSGLCTAKTLRRHQPDPCILRCANYCLYKAKSKPLCQKMDDWLVQKVYKIARKSFI